jgi:hypothetical protein
LGTKIKYEIAEIARQDQILTDINHSKEEEETDNREAISCIVNQIVANVQRMYKEIEIPIFSDEFYSTARFCKLWKKMTNLIIFIVHDIPEESSVIIYSQIYILSENYKELVEALPCSSESIPYQWFEENFSVVLRGAEWPDKLIIFKFLTDGLNLKQAHKRETLQNGEVKEVSQEDLGTTQSSTYELKMSQLKVVASKTIYFGQEYIYPVTLRVLSLNGCPTGLSVMIYDVEQCAELPIFFLVVHPRRIFLTEDAWRREENLENIPPTMSERDFVKKKFFLIDFLENGGWESLISNLRPYVASCIDEAMEDEDFFFDSFEHFL